MSESRNVSNLMIGDCDGWWVAPSTSPQGTSIGVLTLHHFVEVSGEIVFGLWRHVRQSRGT